MTDIKEQQVDDILDEIEANEKKKDNEIKRKEWTIDAQCELYQRSRKKWVKATIINIYNDDDNEWLIVKHKNSKLVTFIEEVQRNSDYIRPINSLQLLFNDDINRLIKVIGDKTSVGVDSPSSRSVHRLIAEYGYGFNHRFNSNKCNNQLILTNDNRSVIMRNRNGWSRSVHCADVMKTGVHFIEFEINSLTDYIFIGIHIPNLPLDRYIGYNNDGYSYVNKGIFCHNADPYVNNSGKNPYDYWKKITFTTNDRIGMILDLNSSSLTFLKNGECLDDGFDIKYNDDIGYVFAVSVQESADMVSIIQEEPDKLNNQYIIARLKAENERLLKQLNVLKQSKKSI